MKRSVLTLFFLLLSFGSIGLLAGCNTTAGAGADVSATGHAVTHTADEVKNKL
jgi:predicted small secreted protein